MSTKNVALAVFLRRAQWLLDDLAFHATEDALNNEDIDTTTAALEELIHLLNENRPPKVIDESPTRCTQPGPQQPAYCPYSSASR